MKHPALRRLAEKIQNLPVKELLEDAAHDTKEEAAKLQREQMMEGKRADGSDIAPFYTPFTIAYKRRKGQPTDRVTLKDRGDFHAETFAAPFEEGIQFGSTDEKTQKLEAKYGPNLLGLNKEQIPQYLATLKPVLQGNVKRWWKNR